LLECGVHVDILAGSGETSLYLASSSGKLDVARFLIERGADIHTNDDNPLHSASQNGHLDVMQMLIDIGIAIDIRNRIQMTPLALSSTKGKVEVARFLIERGADVTVRDNNGCQWSPLHFASGNGHLDMARLLLDRGVDANIRRDDLWSPLHLVSANGHLHWQVAELLVQCGASVGIFNGKQETPLYQAVKTGEVAIVRLLTNHSLVHRVSVHSADSNGWSPLDSASQGGHLDVVKRLLRRSADVDALNKADKTAAEFALENGHAEVAKFIAMYKADANI
jgi:ankyrin repeat protein